MRSTVGWTLALLSSLAMTGSGYAASAIPAYVAAAVADAGRPPAEIKRDAVMKPADAMAFAGIKPGQAVVDFIPGDTYYTRVLAKIVGSKGDVYPFVPFTGPINAATKREQAKGVPDPVDAPLALQSLVHYPNITTIWEFLMLSGGQFALPKQLDAVWTADNYHDLHTPKLDAPDTGVVSKNIFAAIKPGGVYIVSDARAAKGKGFTDAATLGRSDEDAVKAEILAAGFVLDGESDVLANAGDDHTKAASSFNGNADRFLLRFKKPLNSPPDKRAQGMKAVQVLYGNTLVTGLDIDRQRDLFFHPDGTYEEFGRNGSAVQEGYWYIGADARLCILHQFPAPENGYTFCLDIPDRKLGEKWNVVGRRGAEIDAILPGLVYP